MRRLLKAALAAALPATLLWAPMAHAQESAKQSWSFDGVFGTFDRASANVAYRSMRKSVPPATP